MLCFQAMNCIMLPPTLNLWELNRLISQNLHYFIQTILNNAILHHAQKSQLNQLGV